MARENEISMEHSKQLANYMGISLEIKKQGKKENKKKNAKSQIVAEKNKGDKKAATIKAYKNTASIKIKKEPLPSVSHSPVAEEEIIPVKRQISAPAEDLLKEEVVDMDDAAILIEKKGSNVSNDNPFFEVPEKIKDYINVVDCSDFDEEKYFVTEQVSDIKEIIIKTKNKSNIIQNVVGIAYPNTTLLWGTPGTGKTSLCKFLAHEFDVPFVYLNFAKIFNGVFGQTSAIISDVFKFIADKECIFCIDEIDAISQRRGTESDVTGGEISRVTISLMQAIDDLRNHESNAIIIACTNRVDIMDEALRSRFSVERQVKNLTIAEKHEYIMRFLDKVNRSLVEQDYSALIIDNDNILSYCRTAASYSQRDVEMDLIRCLSLWLDDVSLPYKLDHVQKKAI